MLVDLAQGFQQVTAFVGKSGHHVHKLASCVQETVAHDRFKLLGQVALQTVTHLDRWSIFLCPLASTSVRFSPACLRPVKNRAIFWPARVDTIPEVKIPVRSASSSSAAVGSDSARDGKDANWQRRAGGSQDFARLAEQGGPHPGGIEVPQSPLLNS